MNKMRLIAAVGACAFVAGSALATSDNLIQGVAANACGDQPPFGAVFNPGDTTFQMMDDGTNGDVTSNDNVYTRQLTGITPALTFSWKVASSGWGPVNAPSDTDLKATAPASGTVNLYIRTTPYADGYKPDVEPGAPFEDGYAWSDQTRAAVDAATTITLVGDFQSERGGTDWDTADSFHQLPLTDAAAGTTGDGIFGGSMTGLPAGTYNFKAVLNSTFSPAAFGNSGFAGGGGNFSFNVITPADVITFTLNGNTGRLKADNPTAVAGPPFYAQSDGWSSAYSAAEQLPAAVGNVYSRTFTVATPGNHKVTVRQGVGRSFPNSGGVPYTTTTPNQQVLVIFDRNTYADAGVPNVDFVCVVDNTTHQQIQSYSYVQPVGNFQSDFGGSNWDANAGPGNFQEAKDDGVTATSGDHAAGDGVYAVKMTALSNTNSPAAAKVVGQRTGVANDNTNPYTCQFGGATNGATADGNNEQPNITYATSDVGYWQIDTLTGRVVVAFNSNPPRQARPSLVAPFTSVQDWTSIE